MKTLMKTPLAVLACFDEGRNFARSNGVLFNGVLKATFTVSANEKVDIFFHLIQVDVEVIAGE